MSDDEGAISTEVIDDHILAIGIDRAAKYNGVTPEMMDSLVDAYTRLDDDPDLWVGLLFGHGDHFTAGLDLPRWTARMTAGTAGRTTSDQVDPTGMGRATTKPVITAVQGITFTVGIELALAGDIVIAADDCRFSQLETRRGIQATGGATIRFVERAGWGNAMYHLLTGDEFDAAEAYRIGFVQEVVPTGSQYDRALELARVIALENAPLAVQATKASSRRYLLEGQEAAAQLLHQAQKELMGSNDADEGVQSFVERRAARFTGT